MTKEQVYKILKRIKANYSTFRDSDIDVVQEWCDRLSKYDYQQVLQKLDQYFDYGKEPPLINDLTENLSRIDQQFEIEGYIVCNKCGRKYDSIEKVNLCYERDLILSQVDKYCKLFNIDKKKYFKNDTLQELNDNYDQFLLQVIEHQKANPLLHGKDLEGLRMYYKNVLRGKYEKK